MTMSRTRCARFAAGAFFLALVAAPAAGRTLRLAAERPDGACAPAAGVLGILRAGSPAAEGASSRSGCLLLVRLEGLTDAELDTATAWIASARGVSGTILALPETADGDRFAYTVKRLASAARAASPEARVALDAPAAAAAGSSEELRPYVDAVVVRPGQSVAGEDAPEAWVLASASEAMPPVAAVLGALAAHPRAELVAIAGGAGPLGDADLAALGRLQRYFTDDVSADPTPTRATRGDGTEVRALRYFDGKAFTPIVLLPADPAGEARLVLSGGPFDRASVENLGSGVRRDFEIRGGPALTLDLSRGPLAVVLKPSARAPGDTRAAVDVGAERGLTADEIIARERAWDAGQREKVAAYAAKLDTSLRFRVAEYAGSLDLTIRGPYFWRRGEPADWAWEEFFLNGVRWKGRTLPKLPILQPEKVTTLPLDIRLGEEYVYALDGQTQIDGRPAYRIAFRPRSEAGDKPIYRGTAWIDRETFALIRRESIQLNLKGDTLSNVQTEYYRAVPSRPEVVLPLEIRGQQVFSTAGRTTAIERHVLMQDVEIDPPDFAARRDAAYASPSQMVRDTDAGLRYLVPDEQRPGARVVEASLTRKSLFGIAGGFYQSGQDYPFPLLGVQYFDFDVWHKNKQLSVFFAGALLFANYTDPSLFGSRFDVGADVFGVAIPFVEQSYREGEEIRSERIKHLPEFLQVNVGHPLGPYLKASLGLFTQWDNYQRDEDTGPAFVTPVDTFTNGAEARLSWNQAGYNLSLRGGYFSRAKWEPWGDPATSGYDPKQKDYWKYSADLTKGFFFSNFRKLLVKATYLDGKDLDRFSQWDFGPFGQTTLHGFPSGSVRADRAALANLSYGINIENVVRFEVFYDQAFVTNAPAGYDWKYFSGAGIATAFNGPWNNTRIRAEVGVPVVRNGVSGFTISAQLLKLF